MELQRENEEKLWQEGILRHVPVVGSFVNWFSPPPKEAGIKGRSLNLRQGVVESTENIYKYHMQLPSSGGNQQQIPNAQSQTPVSGHSRSESQSSTVSAAANKINSEAIIQPPIGEQAENNTESKSLALDNDPEVGDVPVNSVETKQEGVSVNTDTPPLEQSS